MTIADLKPYTAMKDSGVLWLGEVPEHWAVRRGKNIFRCVDVRSETGKEELLTVSSERGVVPRRSTTVTMFKAESYVGHKLCWPGDLVINSLWAWARGLGVSRYHGIVSTAYGVYRPLAGEDVESRFIHGLVRSTPFHWELQVRSKGVWTSRLQLTDESFLGAPFPLPPPYEQAVIGRFLDYMDRRIRRYIRAKQKLIKLLEEQKQAIIHRAVTRGLDSNVRLKPSGVEWLGDVPEHWEVLPLKRVSKVIDGDRGSEYPNVEDFVAQGVPFLSSKSIKDGRLNFDNSPFISDEKFQKLREGKIRPGDLVMTVRGTIGNSALFSGDLYNTAFINAQMMILRPNINRILSSYFLKLAQSRYFNDLLAFRAYGSAQQQLTNQLLSALPLPLPPIEEQGKIIIGVKALLRTADTALDRTQREISILREYRTRLIADVVTGKIDVREATAGLPDEAEEPELVNEGDAMSTVDDEPVDDLDTAPEEVEA